MLANRKREASQAESSVSSSIENISFVSKDSSTQRGHRGNTTNDYDHCKEFNSQRRRNTRLN